MIKKKVPWHWRVKSTGQDCLSRAQTTASATKTTWQKHGFPPPHSLLLLHTRPPFPSLSYPILHPQKSPALAMSHSLSLFFLPFAHPLSPVSGRFHSDINSCVKLRTARHGSTAPFRRSPVPLHPASRDCSIAGLLASAPF